MVSRLIGLASTLILARVLLPADFGIVAMATTLSAAVATFSQLGLQDALVRRIGDDRDLFGTAFTLQLCRAVLLAVIVGGAAPAAVWWFTEPRLGPILLVLAGNILVEGLENVAISDFRRGMNFDMQFRLMLVPRLLQVAVTVPMALLLQSYWALLAGIVVSQATRTAMSYVLHPYRPRLQLAGWQKLAGFSLWTWAGTAVGVIWERADPFVLGPVIGTTQLGLYLLAAELAILPATEVVAPVADALFAGFAVAQKQGNSSLHHAPQVAATLVMLVLPLVITISCGSGYVVAALLGPKWVAADGLVAVMAWLCVFSPLGFISNVVLVANGLVRRAFIGRCVASAAKIVALIGVVQFSQRLDTIAVAMTACVAIESSALVLLLKGGGEVRLGPMAAAIGRALLCGLVVIAVLYSAGLAWQPVAMPSLQAFAYGAALGAMVAGIYVVLVLTLWQVIGRPDGPEQRILDLGGKLLRRVGRLIPRLS